MRSVLILFVVTLFSHVVNGQSADSSRQKCYEKAFDRLCNLEREDGCFKDAVFTVENAYFNDQLNRQKFDNYIITLKDLCRSWSDFNKIHGYNYNDSTNFQVNFSLYAVMKDTIKMVDTNANKFYHLPFTYDFRDYAGNNNWANMFVSKLLITHSGNCHSIPYLYKILADELGASCWLALAPNHIYIKNRSEKIGWYNTELTNGTFPVDGWIMASGYLPLQAVQNGIYMDTLSNQASIALCLLDLAKGYEHITGNYNDGFILKCCDSSLKYFPLNILAMLLKAETLQRIYQSHQNKGDKYAAMTYQEMESIYVRLFDLGYREMPEKMYLDWLQSINKEKMKYEDSRITGTIHTNAK